MATSTACASGSPCRTTTSGSVKCTNAYNQSLVAASLFVDYVFLDTDERAVFELVQTISGVGPRLALAILSTLSPDELRVAVARNDLATLTKVPGVGQKGAGRLVLELKGRIGPPTGGSPISAGSISPAGWQGAVGAGLMSLGWSQREAEAAVSAVTPLAAEMADPDIAVLLKAALQSLDRS